MATKIIPRKESETVELKTSFNIEAVETLVAFANAKGGCVYVGITDTGAVVGVSVSQETIPQWIIEIKTKTEPSLIPDVDTIEIKGKQIVVLSITEFPIKPVSVKGRYYKRIGKSNHLLGLNEILNMHLKTFNSSWDYYFDQNHSVLDISEEKTLNLISLYNRKRPIPIEKDIFEFLSKMELVRDGKLTNAAFLLLMKSDYISVSDLRQGTYVSDCRNKLIVKIFKEIDWIERYGTGVRRIWDYFSEHGSPEPLFENFQHGFKVTAYPLQKEKGFVEMSEKNDEMLGETVEKNH